MKSLFTPTFCLCILLTSNSLCAAEPPASAETVQPKIAPLLLFALTSVGKIALDRASNKGLFSRLYDSIFGVAEKKDKEQVNTASSAYQLALAAGIPSSSIIPSVGYTLEQLDPKTFEFIKTLRLDGAIPTLNTGDVFALHYSTNLPGLVRLENTDSTGLVTNLGVYTVLPDQDNRIPSNRGIALTGEPGNEIVKVLFYPCIPRQFADKPAGAALAGKIPACDANSRTHISAAAEGSIRSKALVNLDQPDPTIAFSGTSDYQANDVTSTVMVLRHQKP